MSNAARVVAVIAVTELWVVLPLPDKMTSWTRSRSLRQRVSQRYQERNACHFRPGAACSSRPSLPCRI